MRNDYTQVLIYNKHTGYGSDCDSQTGQESMEDDLELSYIWSLYNNYTLNRNTAKNNQNAFTEELLQLLIKPKDGWLRICWNTPNSLDLC